MKNILTIIGAVLFSLAAVHFMPVKNQGSAVKKETVYERVMRTGTIRCGYVIRPPYFTKDPNTGKFSGIFYDITNEIGKRLSLKIDYVEEVLPADFVVGLQNNQFDTVCNGVWLNAQRARAIDFSVPVLYDMAGVFARAEDNRFQTASIDQLNNSANRFSVMEGAPATYLTRLNFPDAHKITTSEGATPVQVALDLISGKSDMAVYPLSDAAMFLETHPNAIKPVPAAAKLGAFSVTYPTAYGQDAFRQMLSNTILDMQNQGIIARILAHYPVYAPAIKQIQP